jgi:hypothetical protein
MLYFLSCGTSPITEKGKMVQLSPKFVFPLTTTCDFILQFSPTVTPPESMMEYAPIEELLGISTSGCTIAVG